MSYTDVTVVWEGAVSDDKTFTDDQDMRRFIAMSTSDLVEIYTLPHDHDVSDEDCVCAQYLTDHTPEWSSQ